MKNNLKYDENIQAEIEKKKNWKIFK
jgi:hypothetical protein